MLKASIDLGTNTCLMLMAEVESGHVNRVLGDYARIVRLGEGVDKARCLQPDAIERTLMCLDEYRQIISKAGILPADVVCVATSQARDAENGEEFFLQVEAESDFRFRVISGQDEARLSFLGSLLPDMESSNHAVVDIGGGSTEFVTAKEDRSIDLGSVRFTERYLKSDPVIDEEFSICLNEIEKVQLTDEDLRRMVECLKLMTIAERREQVGIEPKRADVLLAGAMIMWRTMEKLNFHICNISTRGLRYGVLMDL